MFRERVSMLRLYACCLSCQDTVKPAFSGPARGFSYVTNIFRFIRMAEVKLALYRRSADRFI